jgi:excinuclease ABC subunit A
MGPEGGSRGGLVIAEGTPEEVAANPASYTGQYLAPLLEGRAARAPKKAPAKKRPAKKAAAKTAAAKKSAAPAKRSTKRSA